MEDDPDDWWTTGKIPPAVVDEVKKRIKKEIDAGVTERDYITFGELVTSNWDIFGSVFCESESRR